MRCNESLLHALLPGSQDYFWFSGLRLLTVLPVVAFRCRAILSIQLPAFRDSRAVSWNRCYAGFLLPVATLVYNSLKTGKGSIAEFSSTNPMRLVRLLNSWRTSIHPIFCNEWHQRLCSSSTVSLKASEGVASFAQYAVLCCENSPCMQPIKVPRSPVRSLYTFFWSLFRTGNRYPLQYPRQ